MVRAWYFEESSDDKSLPHLSEPPKFISVEDLAKKTNLKYFKIDADNYKTSPELLQIAKEQGFTYEDECDIKCQLDEETSRNFYSEHLHADDEIRLILDGCGYFDVRDNTDAWVRIEVVKGDLLIVPAGIYHRFTLDTKNQIRLRRYFIGEPKWKAHYRPADDLSIRKEYLCSLAQ